MCNDANFTNLRNPPLQNSSSYVSHNPTPTFIPISGTLQTNNCDVVFLLDLDSTFTTEENYTQVIQFISDATDTCMKRGVGYAVFAFPMFNDVG